MYGRWWTLRCNCLGGIWGNLDDLMLLVGNKCYREEDSFIRHQLHKWIVSIWLLCQFSFTNFTDDEALETLRKSGKITTGEKNLLQGQASQPQIICCWIGDLIGELCKQGRFQHEFHLQQLVIQARGSIGYLYAHFDTPLLYAWVHLMATFINATTLVHAVNEAIMIADYWDNDVLEDYTDETILVSSIVAFLFRFFFFQGLLTVVEMLKNPFAPSSWAMPLLEFAETFTKDEKLS